MMVCSEEVDVGREDEEEEGGRVEREGRAMLCREERGGQTQLSKVHTSNATQRGVLPTARSAPG